MSNISTFWGKGRASRWLRVLLGLPVAAGILAGIAWIGLSLGALDRFPWPQHLVFDGDADAFISCFETRAKIARGLTSGAVTLFSERLAGEREILLHLGSFIGADGTRALELLRTEPGFVLRDLHYLPEHSPLSAPMSKLDWVVAWRCREG